MIITFSNRVPCELITNISGRETRKHLISSLAILSQQRLGKLGLILLNHDINDAVETSFNTIRLFVENEDVSLLQ